MLCCTIVVNLSTALSISICVLSDIFSVMLLSRNVSKDL
jgi:hypothetical protein